MKSKFYEWYTHHDKTIQAVMELGLDFIPGGNVLKGLINVVQGRLEDKKEMNDEEDTGDMNQALEKIQIELEGIVEEVEQLEDFKKSLSHEEIKKIIKKDEKISEQINKTLPNLEHSISYTTKSLDKYKAQEELMNGKYILEDCIGKGGQGVIYKARNTFVDEYVAIKMLSFQKDGQSLERLKKEYRRLVKNLVHKNIIQYRDLDFDSGRGQWFLSMDYVAGENLREQMLSRKEKKYTVENIYSLLLPVGEALEHAHSKNIIHCDLKPENILVDINKNTFLTDFGMSKEINMSQELSSYGGGTLAYMSPEQYQGHSIENSSDLWAFGVIIYEMLAGERPFNAQSITQFSNIVCYEDPKPLEDANLWNILKIALHKEVSKRCYTPVTLLEKLMDVSKGIEISDETQRMNKEKELLEKIEVPQAYIEGQTITERGLYALVLNESEIARKCFTVEKDNITALRQLVYMYTESDSQIYMPGYAFGLLEEFCEKDLEKRYEAEYIMGMMYEFGIGIDVDYEKAKEIYERSKEGQLNKKFSTPAEKRIAHSKGISLEKSNLYRVKEGVHKEDWKKIIWESYFARYYYLDSVTKLVNLHKERIKSTVSRTEDKAAYYYWAYLKEVLLDDKGNERNKIIEKYMNRFILDCNLSFEYKSDILRSSEKYIGFFLNYYKLKEEKNSNNGSLTKTFLMKAERNYRMMWFYQCDQESLISHIQLPKQRRRIIMDRENTEMLFCKGNKLLKEEVDEVAKGEGVELLLEAARKGNKSAMERLAVYYLFKQDYSQAFSFFQYAFDCGSEIAIDGLMKIYEKMDKDDDVTERRKLKWYEESAEKGNTLSMLFLGNVYMKRFDKYLEESSEKAIYWYRRAADKNNVSAMIKLASSETSKKKATETTREIIKWLKRASALGCEETKYSLAQIYLKLGNEKESEKWLLEYANAYTSTALLQTALHYDLIFKKKNLKRAVEWYEKAIQCNVPDAYYLLAKKYASGDDDGVYRVEYDIKKAVDLLDEGRKLKHDKSMVLLGDIHGASYLKSKRKKNLDIMLDLYNQAAELGNSNAMVKLGNIYAGKDEMKAVTWYMKASEKGSAEGAFKTGEFYRRDLGLGHPEPKIAIDFYMKALERGNNDVHFIMGNIYREGYGPIKQDAEKAIEHFQQATHFNNEANMYLGHMYEIGYGTVEARFYRAISYYEKAMEKGDIRAGFALGKMYENTLKDNEIAYLEDTISSYKKSAEEGNICSMIRLGNLLLKDYYYSGINSKELEAVKWYNKAALEGKSIQAMKQLGNLYIKGYRKIIMDPNQALEWYKKASEIKEDNNEEKYIFTPSTVQDM